MGAVAKKKKGWVGFPARCLFVLGRWVDLLVVPSGCMGGKENRLPQSLPGGSRGVLARGLLHDWRLADLRLR